MEGFTYNGIHSSEYGLYYIPSKDDLWFNDPEYDVYSADVDWKHGGYGYGRKAKVRTFSIKCFFEEIDLATREAIKRWVGRDTGGRLIFDDKKFVYWNVQPGKIPVGNWYIDHEKHSGTVTLTFEAYEPFGYLVRKANSSAEVTDDSDQYVNLIAADDMPAAPTVSDTSFDIYNPGTEACGLHIDLAGTMDHPFRFFNENNKTFCEFNSLPTNGLRLSIDGDTGYVSTYLAGSDDFDNGYAYHNKGVVRLEPNFGKSKVPYEYLGLNGTLHVFALDGYRCGNELMGAELLIENVNTPTFKVVAVSRASGKVFCEMNGSGTFDDEGFCTLKTVNHIVIEEKSGNQWVTPTGLNLTYISVDYQPRAL